MLENLNAGWVGWSTLGLVGLLERPVGRVVRRTLGGLSEEVCGVVQRDSRSSEDGRGFGLGSRGGAKMGKECVSFRAIKKKKKKIKLPFFNFH